MSINDAVIRFMNRNLSSKMINKSIPNNDCWNCGRPIFNMDSHFGKIGLCVYCNNAREFGVESTRNNYRKQLILVCQKCGHKLAYQDKNGSELFEINNIALCCDHPDYTYDGI